MLLEIQRRNEFEEKQRKLIEELQNKLKENIIEESFKRTEFYNNFGKVIFYILKKNKVFTK